MEEKQFGELSKRLDMIIKLLAVQTVGGKSGRESIKLLADSGFSPKDIASFIGTTPHTVSVALHKMKGRK